MGQMNYRDNRKRMINQIGEWFAAYVMDIREKAKGNDLAGAVYAEDNVRDLLNFLKGWNLENGNKKTQNVAGIDLVDEDKKYCVQVTVTKTAEKIRSSLRKTHKVLDDGRGWNFKMLILSEEDDAIRKLKTRSDLEDDELSFDPKMDIWDFTWIYREIIALEIDKLVRAYDLCQKMFEGQKQEETLVGPVNPYMKDCTDEFRKKWEKPLFLNNGDKDKDQVTILQKELYLAPYYTEESEEEKKVDLLDFLGESGGKLVLGQPGIGKSTLITYYLNNSEDDRKMRVFRIADFSARKECEEWRSGKRYAQDYLLRALGLNSDDLNHSVLFLDGLDEINLAGEERIDFLNQLLSGFEDIYDFTWIVTCRTNYIDVNSTRLEVNYATLQEWDEEQIEEYIDRYSVKTGLDTFDAIKENAKENYEVLGIPLILYMVLASGISMEEDASLAAIYNSIFNLEKGGIYDKVINGRRYDILPNATVKEKKELIHKISQEIAFWMFEHNADQAVIPQEEYQKILRDNGDLDGTHGIGSFFQTVRHTEGIHELSFVHRSMYEYFTADYLVSKLREVLNQKDETHPFGSPEKFCKTLAHFSKKGFIWDGDEEAPLLYTLLQACINEMFRLQGYLESDEQRQGIYFWWEERTIHLFEKGPLFYAYDAGKIEECRNILQEDLNAGQNILHLLSMVYELYNPTCEKEKHVRMFTHALPDSSDKDNIYRYIRSIAGNRIWMRLIFADLRSADLSYADMSSADMSSADMRSADMSSADLRDADMSSADLRSADLSSADMRSADMSSADMSSADLRYADMRSADLSDTDLSSANLRSADLSDADLSSADMSSADMRSADMRYADLSSANLSYADLRDADLRDADLRDADLRDADLRDADLRDADLMYADLEDTKITTKGRTRFTGFSEVDNFPLKNIDSARFDNIFVDEKRYNRKEFFACIDENGMFHHKK